MKIKYFKIIVNILRRKLKIKDLLTLMKVMKIVQKITNFKLINFKELQLLNTTNIRFALMMYNDYTKDKPINIEKTINIILIVLDKLIKLENNANIKQLMVNISNKLKEINN